MKEIELIDIFDSNENYLETVKRDDKNRSAGLIKVVHCYIYHPDKGFLIQKRSTKKILKPGIYEITTGAVLSAEEPKKTVYREVYEELGLQMNDDIVFLGKFFSNNSIQHVYFYEDDFDISKLQLQEEEVESVKFISPDEMISMIKTNELRKSDYKNEISGKLMNLIKRL